jgi:hypothetical protein
MKATLFVIVNDVDHAQAKELIEKLMGSNVPTISLGAASFSMGTNGDAPRTSLALCVDSSMTVRLHAAAATANARRCSSGVTL